MDMRKSFAELGIVKVIGFNSSDRKEWIFNLQLKSGELRTAIFNLAARKFRIEE